MVKKSFEIRDAVHGFVYHDGFEKDLINSAPVQRLRSIHQLAMTYQIYPGASHRRFEHSLGVMEIAGRIYDALLSAYRTPEVESRLFRRSYERQKYVSRSLVRAAALLHDVGHLPFSHAAENLLPDGCNHEVLTASIIRNSEISDILKSESINPDDVIMIACEQEHFPEIFGDNVPNIKPWMTVLNEIITGDTFGADRIDYLLRDSHHTGMVSGKFDLQRLIEGLRLVVNPETEEIEIGMEKGALHTAEQLLLARYFMYSQVYFHKTRCAYNIHLNDFLTDWLEEGRFSGNWEDMPKLSDDEVLVAVREAMLDTGHSLHLHARRLVGREHYRVAYAFSEEDLKNPTFFEDLLNFATIKFGEQNVRGHFKTSKSKVPNFFVVSDNDEHHEFKSPQQLSKIIANLPSLLPVYIFVDHTLAHQARKELKGEADRLSAIYREDRGRLKSAENVEKTI